MGWITDLHCVHIVTLLLLFIKYTRSGDPTISPATVTDTFGNVADENSTITWAGYPGTVTYVGYTEKKTGLEPLYDIVRKFVNIVIKIDDVFLQELIVDLYRNGFGKISNHLGKVINGGIGLVICAGLGFLFIIFSPIVGLFFCCCRCCCKCCACCGGRGHVTQKEMSRRRCQIFFVILIVNSLFLLVGSCLVYSSSVELGNTLLHPTESIADNINDNLGDLDTFLNNTVDEIQYLSRDGFSFVTDVVTRDLENIDALLGVTVKNKLDDYGGVDAAVDAIISLDSTVQTVGSAILAVNSSIATLSSKTSTLSSDLSTAKTNLDTTLAMASCTGACSVIDSSVLAIDFDTSSLPDISTQVALMDTVLANNLTALAIQGKATFDDIPEKVRNETQSSVADIKGLLDSFKGTVGDQIDSISDVAAELNIAGLKQDVKDMFGPISDYDSYGMYMAMLLASVAFSIALIMIVAIVLMPFCYSGSIPPTERGKGSHCTGCLLMLSVYIALSLSWLLCLLTTITFIIGAPLDRFLCQPLVDDDMNLIKKTMDTPGSGSLFDDYFIADALYGNGTIPLTLSGVLQGCKENNAAFTVLKLDSKFDINTVTDYKKTIDIDTQLAGINVNLTNVQILSPSTKSQLEDFRDGLNLDFTNLKAELSKKTTQGSLSDLVAALRAAAASISDPAKSSLETNANEIEGIESGSYAAVDPARGTLYSDVVTLENSVSSLPTLVNYTIDTAEVVDSYLATNASAMILKEVVLYTDRVLAIADSFATNVNVSLRTSVGHCRPLWNAWYSMVNINLCNRAVNNLNAFWFTMGWCVAFLFLSIIFNTKLAKHLRRAQSCEGYDNFIVVASKHSTNKVGSEISSTSLTKESGKNKTNSLQMKNIRNKVGHFDI